MPKITFANFNETYEVPAGTSVLECALENNLPLDHDCGGNCACTTCHIMIEEGQENIEPMSDDERSLLEANDKFDENSRLGCQSRVKAGSITIRIPD